MMDAGMRMYLNYYTKGVFLSISTNEAFGQESGKCLERRIHESDARVQPAGQRKQLPVHAGPTRE